MTHWMRGICVLALLLTLMGGAGCVVLVAAGAGAAVAVGAAEYIGGEMRQAYAASMEQAWNASLAAAEELRMKAVEKSLDNLDQNRVIKGKTYEGKEFQISLQAMAKDVTLVKVRIGTFGDEDFSKKIHAAVAKNLKK